jgi:hypothetical protein
MLAEDDHDRDQDLQSNEAQADLEANTAAVESMSNVSTLSPDLLNCGEFRHPNQALLPSAPKEKRFTELTYDFKALAKQETKKLKPFGLSYSASSNEDEGSCCNGDDGSDDGSE